MLVSIVGMPGSYKTTWLTALAYDAYQSGRNVMSNYDLYFPPERAAGQILPLDLARLGEAKDTLWDLFLALDEIHVYFDARRSGSEQNVKGTQILAQARKRNCDVAGTMLRFGDVDLRYRSNCALLFLMRRPDPMRDMGNAWLYDPRSMNRLLPKPIAFDPTPVFPLFDTHQRQEVKPTEPQ